MVILCIFKMMWISGERQKEEFNMRDLPDKILQLGKSILLYDPTKVSIDLLNIFFTSMFTIFGCAEVENFIRQDLKSDLFLIMNQVFAREDSYMRFVSNMNLIFDSNVHVTKDSKPTNDKPIENLMKYSSSGHHHSTLNAALLLTQLTMHKESENLLKKLRKSNVRGFTESALLAMCLCMIKNFNKLGDKSAVLCEVVPILKDITEYSQFFEGNGKKICLAVHMALAGDYQVIFSALAILDLN